MYVSIDIGGTNIRVASSSNLSDITLFNTQSWKSNHNFEKDFEKLLLYINKIGHTVAGVGIGIPGDIDEHTMTVYSTSWNHEWENKPIIKLLSDKLSCPVFMDNDAAVAALGEAYYGQYNHKEFTYITWGTGIGGATIKEIDGVYYTTKLDWDMYFETWEKICGGRMLEQAYNKKLPNLSAKEWQHVIDKFAKEMSIFNNKLQQKHIILGGGITDMQKEKIILLHSKWIKPDLSVSSLGKQTGLYGGFALIRKHLVNQ